MNLLELRLKWLFHVLLIAMNGKNFQEGCVNLKEFGPLYFKYPRRQIV